MVRYMSRQRGPDKSSKSSSLRPLDSITSRSTVWGVVELSVRSGVVGRQKTTAIAEGRRESPSAVRMATGEEFSRRFANGGERSCGVVFVAKVC
jgi:hypothetical protein